MMQTSNKVLALGYLIGLLVLAYFSFRLLTVIPPWIVIDNANLAIHEGGHLLFSPFVQFIYILGGSLFQTLVPILFFGYFFYNKKAFSSLFCLFWTGDNLISVATYMKDARSMQLPLLGGDIHDWHWLFSTMHLLDYDQIIGGSVFILGTLCLVLSLVGIVMLIFATLSSKPSAAY